MGYIPKQRPSKRRVKDGVYSSKQPVVTEGFFYVDECKYPIKLQTDTPHENETVQRLSEAWRALNLEQTI